MVDDSLLTSLLKEITCVLQSFDYYPSCAVSNPILCQILIKHMRNKFISPPALPLCLRALRSANSPSRAQIS